MWIWNLSITGQELEKQLTALISKGFGGVVIRPGRDMFPAYMSQEFLENFGQTLEIARQHGIGVRLADDFSLCWSGGLDSILSQSRKLRAEYLVLEREASPAPGTLDCEINLDPNESYIAQAVNKSGSAVISGQIKNVSIPAGSSSFNWKAPGADWSLLIYKKTAARDPVGGAVPNIVNPKFAALYIQNVLDVFRTNFSKYIPTTFEGFVTEMPGLRPGGNGIFWDDDIAVKYKSKYKKDLIGLLPSLFLESGSAERTRLHVHTFIFNLMAERFVSPLEVWAKRYRLSQWVLWPETGMYRPENALRDGYVLPDATIGSIGLQNLDGSLDNYALLRTLADVNTNQYRRETITVIGRNRIGMGNTIQSLKREIDLSLLAGPSRVLFDGFFFNIDRRGYYKTPCSPAWYSPEWEHMRLLCDYSSRNQEALKGLQASKEIALLNPSESIISEYLPNNLKPVAKGLTRFQKTIDVMYCSGMGFDVVTEELLLSCAVRQNGEFATADRIRKGNYQALVIPYAPLVTRSLLVFIEKLAAKGTPIVFIDEAPKGTFEDGESATVTARIQKLLASKTGNVTVSSAADLDQSLDSVKQEITLLRENGERADVSVQVYNGEGGRFYLFHNQSEIDELAVIAEMPADKYFAALNCQDGKISEIEPFEVDKAAARARLYFSPLQTLLVVSCASKISSAQSCPQPAFNPLALPPRSYRIVFKDQWTFDPLSMNVLPLSNWNIRIGLSRETGQFSHFYETTFETKSIPEYCVFMLSGLGQSSIPFAGQEVSVNGAKIDRELFSDGKLQTQVESASNEAPFVNDCSLERIFGEKISYYDIRRKIVKGINRLSVRTAAGTVEPQTLVYPPLVMGNFSISKGSCGWALDKPLGTVIGHDSWTKYGYPYLSGRACYSQTFEIPNEFDKLILRFSQVSGAVYVKVNDTDVGSLNWHPMEMDITQYCTSQRNKLSVEVVNTVDNVLRLNGRASGLTGEVFIDVYKA